MNTMQDAVKLLTEKTLSTEDAAVTEYIRTLAAEITKRGEKLTDYYLIRESGQMSFDGGTTTKVGVFYGLKHKSEVFKIDNIGIED